MGKQEPKIDREHPKPGEAEASTRIGELQERTGRGQ